MSLRLRDLLARYGEGITAEPERLDALLMDCCPGKRKEVRLLVTACREGLPRDLCNPRVSPDITLSRHFNILIDSYGFSRDMAYWAVTAWAYALGVPTGFQITNVQSTAGTARTPVAGPPERYTGTVPDQQAAGQPASVGQSTTAGLPTRGTIKARTPLLVALAGLCLIAVIVITALYSSGGGTPSYPSTPQPSSNTATTGQQYTLLTPGTLSIATEAHYPPFETINPATNAFEGFDVDLMDEIGRELGLEVRYTDQAFDSIPSAVQAGKFDAAISAITITAKVQQIIDFTDPYYEFPGQGICVRAGDATMIGPSDIAGKKIGVRTGTYGEVAVFYIGGVTNDDIRHYRTMPEALMALKSGEVEAVVCDYEDYSRFAVENPAEFRYLTEPLTETEYFGIVISKDNPGLRTAINQALTRIKADGRLQKIYDRWFE